MKVGVAREIAAGEQRVALVPDSIRKLLDANVSVLVEKGAGVRAHFSDSAYTAAGARTVSTEHLYAQSDVILREVTDLLAVEFHIHHATIQFENDLCTIPRSCVVPIGTSHEARRIRGRTG